MSAPKIVIATRGSKLALWQATFVARKLRALGADPTLNILQTTGDRVQDRFLHEIGGKGLFVKELQSAMLEQRADIAVHSLKDLPIKSPDGLCFAAFLPRHSPFDILIVRSELAAVLRAHKLPTGLLPKAALQHLSGQKIATGSLRRMGLIKAANPNIVLTPLRGNVDTRLRKLSDREFDGLILAHAGIERLGISFQADEAEGFVLDPSWFVPSASQGILVVEAPEASPFMHTLRQMNCPITQSAAVLERKILELLGGDCTTPIGAFAWDEGGQTFLESILLDGEGCSVQAKNVSSIAENARLPQINVKEMLQQGGQMILEKLRGEVFSKIN